jgi:hypothetical protein
MNGNMRLGSNLAEPHNFHTALSPEARSLDHQEVVFLKHSVTLQRSMGYNVYESSERKFFVPV